MNSGEKIYLEILEEHENVTFYTVRYENEELSETEKFFEENYQSHTEDVEIISKLIDKIGKIGAEERHFRNAGKPTDGLGALPEYYYKGNKLRLYAIKLTPNIVILGNGGHKTTKKYNDDAFLLSCVDLLSYVEKRIKKSIYYGDIVISENKLIGKSIFEIK